MSFKKLFLNKNIFYFLEDVSFFLIFMKRRKRAITLLDKNYIFLIEKFKIIISKKSKILSFSRRNEISRRHYFK